MRKGREAVIRFLSIDDWLRPILEASRLASARESCAEQVTQRLASLEEQCFKRRWRTMGGPHTNVLHH